MIDFSSEPLNPTAEEPGGTSAKTRKNPGFVLGAIALGLVVAFVVVLSWSQRRLNRRMAQVSEQTERLTQRVESLDNSVSRTFPPNRRRKKGQSAFELTWNCTANERPE
jgi:flagellar biogenesis protein FliO